MVREHSARQVNWTGARFFLAVLAAGCVWVAPARGQGQKAGPATVELATPPGAANAGPPLTLSLADALARATRNSPQFQTAVTIAKLAREDEKQAKAAMGPSLGYQMQYLNTEGNGISPVGRFVTNDGVHVYRAWAVAHQDLPASFFIGAGPRRAAYERAVAEANEEIARRGLAVTVTTDYYALLVAERGYATAQEAVAGSQHFLDISEALEKGGEVAHADVIRFQLQASQDERALEDAKLAMSNARLNLAVLLFPTFNENFTVVDDLDMPPGLPTFEEAARKAKARNPELEAALASYRAAGVEVAASKTAFLPSLSVDFDYGIEANALALHSVNTTRPGVRQPNLGYFVTYSLNLPVWDWGARLSKLRQAEDQKQLAGVELSYAQRETLSRLYSDYNEAAVAWDQLASLRRSLDLATHNLDLVTMQYQAGETTVPAVLDAETSMVAARNSYAAGEARYRGALSTLETVTGSF